MEELELFEKVKRALFEDWRAKKIKEDDTYDEKLYKVTNREFIEKCKIENLCKYEELDNGEFKAALATLDYENQPKYEEEKQEDITLFELCLKGLPKEEIARELHKVWCMEHLNNSKCDTDKTFDELSEEDKEYYYNEINICMQIIKNEA